MQRTDYQSLQSATSHTSGEYEEKSKLQKCSWFSMVKNLRIPRVRTLTFPLEMKFMVGITCRKSVRTYFCMFNRWINSMFNKQIGNLIRVFMMFQMWLFHKFYVSTVSQCAISHHKFTLFMNTGMNVED